jgi:hypothetical protein
MADDRLPELPRKLGRYRVQGWIEEQPGVARGKDTVGERGAALRRVAYGVERAEAREAAIARWRSHATVTHPAIVAVLDAGPWEDDAFVAEEELAQPARPLAEWMRDPDVPSRFRVAAELCGVASTLAQKKLRLLSLDAVVDGYGQPKLLGLAAAEDGDGALDGRILELAASVLPEDRRERVRTATPTTLPALLAELSEEAEVPMTPFAADVARGEEEMSTAARSQQMTVALIVIGLSLAVVVVVAWLSR